MTDDGITKTCKSTGVALDERNTVSCACDAPAQSKSVGQDCACGGNCLCGAGCDCGSQSGPRL